MVEAVKSWPPSDADVLMDPLDEFGWPLTSYLGRCGRGWSAKWQRDVMRARTRPVVTVALDLWEQLQDPTP